MSVDDVAREIADGLNCPDFVERPANTCLDCVATIAAILTRHFGEQDSLRAEVERLRGELNRLIGYSLTCGVTNNKGWMERFAEYINHAAETLGDGDRCECTREGFKILRGAALAKGATE